MSEPNNVGIVGRHSGNGGIAVKTGYMKDADATAKRFKDVLDGRGFPSSLDVSGDTVAAPLSALQDSSTLPQKPGYVNKNLVEGLADRDKARVLKNAVMSGEDTISQETRMLQDRLARLAAGASDNELSEALLTPQMRGARKEYGVFMGKNGALPVDSNAMDSFYRDNPIASTLLESAKETNPQGFKGIAKGTLAEAEELKRLLKSAGKRMGEETPKSEAYNTARQQLKDIIENRVPGFRDMNTRYADAKTTQKLFEDSVKRGATSVGGATKSPFWSGLSTPFTGAAALGGTINPLVALAGVGGLAGKAGLRASRRSAGRQILETGSKTAMSELLLRELKDMPRSSAAAILKEALGKKGK